MMQQLPACLFALTFKTRSLMVCSFRFPVQITEDTTGGSKDQNN
jgi:hypothetical protein